MAASWSAVLPRVLPSLIHQITSSRFSCTIFLMSGRLPFAAWSRIDSAFASCSSDAILSTRYAAAQRTRTRCVLCRCRDEELLGAL
jgi:hypothetical protein